MHVHCVHVHCVRRRMQRHCVHVRALRVSRGDDLTVGT